MMSMEADIQDMTLVLLSHALTVVEVAFNLGYMIDSLLQKVTI